MQPVRLGFSVLNKLYGESNITITNSNDDIRHNLRRVPLQSVKPSLCLWWSGLGGAEGGTLNSPMTALGSVPKAHTQGEPDGTWNLEKLHLELKYLGRKLADAKLGRNTTHYHAAD